MDKTKRMKISLLEHILFPSRGVNKDKLSAVVKDKTILITGASFGIGESLAYKLAIRGVTLILVARTEEKLCELKSELESRGATVYIFSANLQDLQEVDKMLQYIHSLPCTIDIFVSNAGKSINRSIVHSLDRFHDFTRTMTLNYYAPVKICLDLIPALKVNKGHLINISTINALLAPVPYWAAYLASKTAFDRWMRSVAPELRASGVAVTSIYPSLVRTRMIEPTESYRNMPAMQPEQMAEIICRSIVKRNRKYAPWWTGFAVFASAVFASPWERLLDYYAKREKQK